MLLIQVPIRVRIREEADSTKTVSKHEGNAESKRTNGSKLPGRTLKLEAHHGACSDFELTASRKAKDKKAKLKEEKDS